jgi:hypothetical protein
MTDFVSDQHSLLYDSAVLSFAPYLTQLSFPSPALDLHGRRYLLHVRDR